MRLSHRLRRAARNHRDFPVATLATQAHFRVTKFAKRYHQPVVSRRFARTL
jgi:hypothetical protein